MDNGNCCTAALKRQMRDLRSKSAVEQLVMPLRVNSLDVVQAARAMVRAHMDNEMMGVALDDVLEQFPDVPADYMICLWIGINAKDGEGLVGT